jgi:hypothetical protein
MLFLEDTKQPFYDQANLKTFLDLIELKTIYLYLDNRGQIRVGDGHFITAISLGQFS